LAASGLYAQDAVRAGTWVNQGVAALRAAHYQEAVDDFEKAVALDPSFPPARLYLATAYMQQYIPGVTSPENDDLAAKARGNFLKLLDQDPSNATAVASLGRLSFNQRNWDDARQWYEKLAALQPDNAAAYYSLGVVEWSQWYPVYGQARESLGMKNGEPGPIADIRVRQDLKVAWGPALERGIADLKRALELQPDYADAMSYMNLFIRERADLSDSKEEYARETAEADGWAQRALDTKRQKAALASGSQLIRVGANVQAYKLIHKVDPVYPALALQARIQGAVRLTLTIGKDGTVQNVMVISGHPLLVAAAVDAAKQWLYEPTLLNGYPVSVVTEVEIFFQLP
jgi:TonB family protein